MFRARLEVGIERSVVVITVMHASGRRIVEPTISAIRSVGRVVVVIVM